MTHIEYKSHVATENVRRFREAFGGDFFYAVKANPMPDVLQDFYQSGIAGFDVASVDEIARVRKLSPTVPVICTHPVKTRDEIAELFWTWHVRSFVVDSFQELKKISDICTVRELEIFVRVKTLEGAETCKDAPLEKFGASMEDASRLLAAIHDMGATPSASFHLGFTPTGAGSYRQVVTRIGTIIERHGRSVNRISIGGGFPMMPSPLDGAADVEGVARHDSLQQSHVSLRNMTFIAEPGRALVADTMDLIVDILLVEGGRIFIDDGVYTTLLDAALMGKDFRISVETPGKSASTARFTIFGRTCDSVDRLPRPYELPRDLEEGDQLRVHSVGAYGPCLTHNFNGVSTAPPLHRLV